MKNPARAPLSLLVLASLVACSGSTTDEPDVVGGLVVAPSSAAPHATASPAAGGRVAVGERWLAYLASEADSAEDLNLDGDTTDLVAVAFDTQSRLETPLAAAVDVRLLGSNVYLVASEADEGLDWSKDGDELDLVLLHWSSAIGLLSPLATLEREEVEVVDDRLFFSIDPELPLAPGESQLCFVAQAQPRTLLSVRVAAAGTGLDPELLGSDEGLVFLAQDETRESADLNGDGDQLDRHVLALLDGTDPVARIRSTRLALVGDSAPLRAEALAGDDWLVAFLVDEASQGGANLNHPSLFDPGWQPLACIGRADVDATDQVLHALFFRAWHANPIASPPHNTGLVGDDRVFALAASSGARFVVGTISAEADEGTCGLNGDGDQDDDVLRWGELVGADFFPHTDAADLVAVEDVPGGAEGVAEVSRRFVVALSEDDDERNWDQNDVTDDDLIAWIDPFAGASTAWTVPTRATNGAALGAAWLAEHPSRNGFLFGDLERVLGRACNLDDADTDDVFALAARFSPGDPDELEWAGYCYGAAPGNVGLVVVGSTAWFRASEAAQGRDVNEDGDLDDQLLLRHEVFPLGRLFYVDVLNDLEGPAVIEGPGGRVAFLVDEAMAGADRNGDGDATDLVLRYATSEL